MLSLSKLTLFKEESSAEVDVFLPQGFEKSANRQIRRKKENITCPKKCELGAVRI